METFHVLVLAECAYEQWYAVAYKDSIEEVWYPVFGDLPIDHQNAWFAVVKLIRGELNNEPDCSTTSL
jgi:hypothetical protein